MTLLDMQDAASERIVKAMGIAEFARRWREGKATLQEIEDADVQLVGLRRLIAEHKHEKAHAANVG